MDETQHLAIECFLNEAVSFTAATSASGSNADDRVIRVVLVDRLVESRSLIRERIEASRAILITHGRRIMRPAALRRP